MTDREKLIELLKKAKAKEQYDFLFGDIDTAIDMPYGAEFYADHLIAHGVTVQEWISVKDRLPEDASTVLAIDSDGTISSAYYVGKWHSGGDLKEDDVTHWMPLPQPPKGE